MGFVWLPARAPVADVTPVAAGDRGPASGLQQADNRWKHDGQETQNGVRIEAGFLFGAPDHLIHRDRLPRPAVADRANLNFV